MNANEDEIAVQCDNIRQTAYELHVYLGVGYLEKVYENALCHRLKACHVNQFRLCEISMPKISPLTFVPLCVLCG